MVYTGQLRAREGKQLRQKMEGWGNLRHEDFVSTTLRCLRASSSCLVMRVPRRASQCMKNGCEKFDLIPITYGRTQYAAHSDVW